MGRMCIWMGKLLKWHLKGKTCNKLANGQNFYDLKKTTPEVALTLPWGYIHVYYYSSQTNSLVSRVSGECLQDHWSSGFKFFAYCYNKQLTWIDGLIDAYQNDICQNILQCPKKPGTVPCGVILNIQY